MSDRWRGFQFEVRPDPLHTNRFEVEFWPNELMAATGPSGQVRAIERGTVVTIEDQPGLKVIGFQPSPKQYSDLQRGDYEDKALEVVRDHLQKS
jgi:hypothetical protein